MMRRGWRGAASSPGAAAYYLKNGLLERHLPRIVAAYRERLAGYVAFTAPQGGMFVWGTLPTEEADPRTLRLCFSMSTPARIRTGVERLEKAFSR
jgi:DNA-binding transcriptional MocR family regulator